MKPSAQFLLGISALLVGGLVFWLVGLWMPGQAGLPELPVGSSARTSVVEAKKKGDTIRQARQDLQMKVSKLAGLQGKEGEHRVFVSAQLVYLPENPEPVQPLDRKMKTEDGMEVGWKIKFALDPADPQIKDGDLDGDGFTNLEEFLAGTDPTRKEDSPAKESKLRSRSADPLPMVVSFPEKSGGIFTVRFQVGSKRAEFKGKPGALFWVMAGPEGVEVFSEQAKMDAVRSRAKESGKNSHAIPVLIESYNQKMELIKDTRAGGVEVEVDNSFLVLGRQDALSGPQKLALSTPQRPQSLRWDVGEVRFYTPAGGGTELGPFRLGETFSYEGKEFALVGRDGKKIELRNLKEADKEPFWVPADATGATSPSE